MYRDSCIERKRERERERERELVASSLYPPRVAKKEDKRSLPLCFSSTLHSSPIVVFLQLVGCRGFFPHLNFPH